MTAITFASMRPVVVDIMLVISGLVVLIADVAFPLPMRRRLGHVALAELLLCLLATFVLDLSGPSVAGAYVGDGLALIFKRIFLVTGILAVLGSLHQVDRDFTRRQGEYYQMLLYSLAGMTLLAGTRDLILLVVAFELMGIPLYVLAAYGKTGPTVGPKPAEAGLKLYLVGAVSSAITLYGASLVFGAAGSTSIAAIGHAPPSPLLTTGIAFLLAGLGFKIGVVPFHMWVPDTYQGTSTPFAGFLSVAPKAAGLVALIQLMLGGFLPLYTFWSPLVLGLALATLIVGNIMALRQVNIKRLLGFSGVAHMGFLLMALSAIIPAADGLSPGDIPGASEGLAALTFYVMAYVVANMGLFMVVEAVSSSSLEASSEAAGESEAGRKAAPLVGEAAKGTEALPEPDSLDAFAGLARRTPWMGMAILLFLLSLAGIPFVVGFWAKLYILLAAWHAGLHILVVAAATLSVVGLFYYMQVVRSIYMREPRQSGAIRIHPALGWSIVLCLVATVAMGFYPGPFIDAARDAAAGFLSGGP